METITRELLMEYFNTDNGLTDDEISELQDELDHAEMTVFQQWGF
jgi:hypothetical protein